jgi:hypothetical protein
VTYPEEAAADGARSPEPLTLDVIKVAVEQQVTKEAAALARHLHLTGQPDPISQRLALKLTTTVLQENLPPHMAGHIIEWSQPRFASWWDMLCATHRGRWWGRLIGLHRRRLRYVDEPLRHRIDVRIRQGWTYPHATIGRSDNLGYPVLHTNYVVEDRHRW